MIIELSTCGKFPEFFRKNSGKFPTFYFSGKVTTLITIITLRGLPQGGGLSPILWSLVADSLLSWLSKQGVFGQGYADDGCVLVCGKVLSTMSDVMQRILRGVESWCNKRDLRVNPGKTVTILFTRKYKPEQLRPMIFYGQQLVLTKQVKYLGVLLDSKLNWKAHNAKYKKALAAFCELRRVAGKTWGTSPKVIHWIYTAALRPMLCYAALVSGGHALSVLLSVNNLNSFKGWHACTLQVLKEQCPLLHLKL